jgi:hypothetical protein
MKGEEMIKKNRSLKDAGVIRKNEKGNRLPYVNLNIRIDEEWLPIIMGDSPEGNISLWIRDAIRKKLNKIKGE